MAKVHSHYENLKVPRDAAPEAIRVAYRALTGRHHPDRNPDDADAERVMAVINVAYAVLSDPAKRREHDRWIAQAEAAAARPLRHRHTLHTPVVVHRPRESPAGRAERRAAWLHRALRLRRHVRGHRGAYAAAAAVAFCLGVAGLRTLLDPGLGSGLIASPGSAAVSGYLRAAEAPNGRAWPVRSGYVEGYEVANRGGLSEVTIDNARNGADMFVKLVSLDGPSALPVRTVFVGAHSQFRVAGLTIGTYDLRYRNLATGALLRTPAFILEEIPMAGGPRHSAPTLPLYETGNGNLQTYELGDAEFF